jgi:hypothetical protein
LKLTVNYFLQILNPGCSRFSILYINPQILGLSLDIWSRYWYSTLGSMTSVTSSILSEDANWLISDCMFYMFSPDQML